LQQNAVTQQALRYYSLSCSAGKDGAGEPHAIGDILLQVLNMPAEKLRVPTPDVGGRFGTKLFSYREYALAAVAAKELRNSGRK
jgi:aerobic carbon-monoxide dehydrogenase large subunit